MRKHVLTIAFDCPMCSMQGKAAAQVKDLAQAVDPGQALVADMDLAPEVAVLVAALVEVGAMVVAHQELSARLGTRTLAPSAAL